MRTKTIINTLDKKGLLEWKAELKSVLDELNWKLIKTERALYLHQSALQECREKLESERKRAEETRMAMQFLSATHPLRYKCEDDLFRTEIRIFRLENKLKKISILKPIQLEIKKVIVLEEIRYYEGVLQEIENMLRPPVVLRKVLDAPDGDVGRNLQPDEGKIFILQPNRKKIDVKKSICTEGLMLAAVQHHTVGIHGQTFGTDRNTLSCFEKQRAMDVEKSICTEGLVLAVVQHYPPVAGVPPDTVKVVVIGF